MAAVAPLAIVVTPSGQVVQLPLLPSVSLYSPTRHLAQRLVALLNTYPFLQYAGKRKD